MVFVILGISIEVNGKKVMFDIALICGTFDAPAKAVVQNIMQFNGFFSCHYCEHPGESIEKRVKYPVRENVIQRNHKDVLLNMKEATISNHVVMGFKGFSVLALAPHFDVVYGFAIDAMHSDYLGIAKALCSSWFDSENHINEFYIGNKIEMVDNNISKIKLFSQCDRNPRTISDRKLWKANEWRDWCLHFSIGVLYTIIPDRFLLNYGEFVACIIMLSSKEVHQSEINDSRNLIENFRKVYQEIYGESKMTYNQHTLTHLPTSVQMLGPVWNFSNFPFESNNGCLINFVKSPKGVIQQIMNKYASTRYINNSNFTKTVNDFQQNMSKGYSIYAINKVLGSGQPMDTANIADFNTHQEIQFDSPEKLFEYSKFVLNKQIFTTKKFSNTVKTNDSAIKLKNGNYGEIIKIFKSTDENKVYLLVDIHAIDETHLIGKISKNYAVINREKEIRTVIVSEECIGAKCVFVDLENVKYFSEQIIFYDHC